MSDIFGIGQGVSGAAQAAATVAAAGIQADAINNATDAQKEAFGTITANNKPFLTTGTSALGRLANIYGLDAPGGIPNNQQPGTQTTATPGPGAIPSAPQPASQGLDPNGTFYQSPDYLFRFGQGIRGVDAGASARHMLDSGATRKAEIQYAGNLASGEFGTYANRLQALAGIGQAAASNQASAAQGYANNIGNLAAAGANNWGNAINGLAGQFKSSYPGSGGGGGGGSGPGTGIPTGGLPGQQSGADWGWS